MRLGDMSPLALLATLALATSAGAIRTRNFNVTKLIIPDTVPDNQDEVEIECQYDANFTLLNWFKGPNEFFRYKPGKSPTTRSFPIVGVGKIEIIYCGPSMCRLKLGQISEEASGLYRCDIERAEPPLMFATKSSYLHVHGHQRRKPMVEGLKSEFGQGDEMEAYCHAVAEAEVRWYVNGHEIEDLRGSRSFSMKASRLLFNGIPPTLTLQCAEFNYGRLYGSRESRARWKEYYVKKEDKPQEQRNITNKSCFSYSSILVMVGNYLLFTVLK